MNFFLFASLALAACASTVLATGNPSAAGDPGATLAGSPGGCVVGCGMKASEVTHHCDRYCGTDACKQCDADFRKAYNDCIRSCS
ncbi:hypothetical protein OC835_006370 [Tilletia horrida]|uniref:Uncharacterized protein n=1 Tax=Tilletia horrida TaxID=155126 RepID=A0AAN6G5C9_9BASI|nr:hypothetical protein OC842_006878 [Tilletia horrida]KAK0523070.1 hypothetical protein OC835_006370 [Tilletia horrida]